MSNLKLVATLRPTESYKTTNAETGQKKPRYRYTVTGSAEALAEYKRIKDVNGFYREDEDGKVLFTSGHKRTTMAIELVDGIIIPKTDDDTIMALESVYYNETDAVIKAHLASKIADAKIAIAMRGTAPAPSSAPVAESAPLEVEEDDANL